jgi:hypothetical protein
MLDFCQDTSITPRHVGYEIKARQMLHIDARAYISSAAYYLLCTLAGLLLLAMTSGHAFAQSALLKRYLSEVRASDLYPGADAYGPPRTSAARF